MSPVSNLTEIRPMRADLIYTDGRTDVSKLIVFLDFRERACNFTCIAKPSVLRDELLKGDLSDRVRCEPRGATQKVQVDLPLSTA
jgi:hypothetical protein